jgi:glycosyltransferase involved in cell wall biosynthesis
VVDDGGRRLAAHKRLRIATPTRHARWIGGFGGGFSSVGLRCARLTDLGERIGPEPDTTIVVPVWGPYAGVTLLEALESLNAQDIRAHVVVVDNASRVPLPTLEGVELVRAQSRLSVGAARNLGVERARTPFVAFWDADDLMLPGTLRLLQDQLTADPRLVAVAAGILEDEPRVPHRWPRPWVAPLARLPGAFALAHCVWSLFPTTGATLMRTDAVRDAGGYADANSGEDWVLGVSLSFRGRIELLRRPGRIYRRQVGSLWEARRSTRFLLRHAAAVDRRLLADPGIPGWAKLMAPAIIALQLLMVLVVRPLRNALRSDPVRVG